MNTQTNQSPADGRLSKQQANDRGGVVSWGEHVSDEEYSGGKVDRTRQ